MKTYIKLAVSASLFTGLCAPEVKADDKCFDLNLTELRQLCRWSGLSKLPLLKIKAGFIEKNGITLKNNLKTCGQGDSIKQYLSQDNDKVYQGTFAKSPTGNPLLGLCTYTVDGQKIGFEIELPAKENVKPEAHAITPEEPAKPKKDPRTMGGVDITTSPKMTQVIIKDHSAASDKKDHSKPIPPNVPPRPTQPHPSMAESHSAQPKPSTTAEHQELEALRKNVPTETPPKPSRYQPSSQPPSRKPPLRPGEVESPQRPQLPPRPVKPEPVTVPEKHEETETPTDFRSELEKRLARQKALADAQSH